MVSFQHHLHAVLLGYEAFEGFKMLRFRHQREKLRDLFEFLLVHELQYLQIFNSIISLLQSRLRKYIEGKFFQVLPMQ